MAEVDDFVRMTFVQELEGVQISNTAYFKIDDLGNEPIPTVSLIDTIGVYHDAIKATTGPAWSIVCGIYENLSRFEGKALSFVTLPGEGIGDTHPSDQVVRMNQYAVGVAPPPEVRRGAWNQAGILESLSTSGRVNDMSAFTAFRAFLDTQFTLIGPGWTMTPQLRYQPTPSPPPRTYAFAPMALNQLSSRFFKLGSRKTTLCRLA